MGFRVWGLGVWRVRGVGALGVLRLWGLGA